MNDKQIEAVLALDGPERVKHFVKVLADREQAWSLYDAAWAASGTDAGQTALPLWPASEYAQLCATGEWSSYSPRAIRLDHLIDAVLPMLRKQGALVAVFQAPSGRGVTITPDELLMMIDAELERY